jgi:hypothetical protein
VVDAEELLTSRLSVKPPAEVHKRDVRILQRG